MVFRYSFFFANKQKSSSRSRNITSESPTCAIRHTRTSTFRPPSRSIRAPASCAFFRTLLCLERCAHVGYGWYIFGATSCPFRIFVGTWTLRAAQSKPEINTVIFPQTGFTTPAEYVLHGNNPTKWVSLLGRDRISELVELFKWVRSRLVRESILRVFRGIIHAF